MIINSRIQWSSGLPNTSLFNMHDLSTELNNNLQVIYSGLRFLEYDKLVPDLSKFMKSIMNSEYVNTEVLNNTTKFNVDNIVDRIHLIEFLLPKISNYIINSCLMSRIKNAGISLRCNHFMNYVLNNNVFDVVKLSPSSIVNELMANRFILTFTRLPIYEKYDKAISTNSGDRIVYDTEIKTVSYNFVLSPVTGLFISDSQSCAQSIDNPELVSSILIQDVLTNGNGSRYLSNSKFNNINMDYSDFISGTYSQLSNTKWCIKVKDSIDLMLDIDNYISSINTKSSKSRRSLCKEGI